MQERKKEKEHNIELEGIGTIQSFYLCHGVTVSFYDLKVTNWENEDKIQKSPNVIEINYCRHGRYECEFAQESFYYLGEGNIAVSRLSDKKLTSGFPLGVYEGINILIDLEQCMEELKGLLMQFDVDTDFLIEKWEKLLPCKIFKESETTRLLFDTLYKMKNKMNYGYLTLKLIELLLLFSGYEMGTLTYHQHLKKDQVEKAKHIKKQLEENLDQNITLKDLARLHGISESTIKRCFQAVYGESPNEYRKEYRMQVSSQLLVETKYSIAEIGLQVGYSNPSKFSNAFYSVLHMTPSSYRIEKKHQ